MPVTSGIRVPVSSDDEENELVVELLVDSAVPEGEALVSIGKKEVELCEKLVDAVIDD